MNDIVYAGKHMLTYNVSRHAHNSWELVYCTGGEGAFLFDDSSLQYREGDIVIIPPLVPHSNSSSCGFTNIHLNLAEATLTFQTTSIVHDNSNKFIRDCFSAAYFHFYSSPEKKLKLLSVYGDLVVCYLQAYQNLRPINKVVEKIESDIIKNYSDCDYELDKYLHSFPFSYDYLRKLFKKELGLTPHKYLNNKRLQAAADILGSEYSKGNNITDISCLCGFREPLYFSRMFKQKYGVSPSVYQQLVASGSVEHAQNKESIKIKLDCSDV